MSSLAWTCRLAGLVAATQPRRWLSLTRSAATGPSRGGSKVPAKRLGVNCFVAGTPIGTRRGLVPIEGVREGDEVWTLDVRTGLWQWQVVERVFSRIHDGSLVGLHAGEEVIIATGRHPAWVVEGAALFDRPITEELGDDNQPTLTAGCWVEAQ